MNLNILLVDDHPVVRHGIRWILERSFKDVFFGEASDKKEAIQEIEKQQWDIVILDLSLPDINGLDLINVVKAASPSAKILVLSIFPEDQFGVRAIQAGAYGYLNKEAIPEKLVTAITMLREGRQYMSAGLFSRLQPTSPSAQLGLASLSGRELSVMRLLYQGRMVKEIAAELSLSPKTVSTYRYRVLEKLQLNSNAELIQFVVKNNIFP